MEHKSPAASSFLWKEKSITLMWVSLSSGNEVGRAVSAGGPYAEEWRDCEKNNCGNVEFKGNK